MKKKLAEKAAEALGINDTSVDAQLLLNGKIYYIDRFDIQFSKSFDHKGEPQRDVKGGLMDLTFNSITNKELNHWMFHNKVAHSGEIIFGSFSRVSDPVITIVFTDGRIARYSKEISSSIFTRILITADDISINGIDHRNDK